MSATGRERETSLHAHPDAWDWPCKVNILWQFHTYGQLDRGAGATGQRQGLAAACNFW